jgi:hypothetical protein
MKLMEDSLEESQVGDIDANSVLEALFSAGLLRTVNDNPDEQELEEGE